MSDVNVVEEIEKISIDALIPYANNARTHTDDQVAQIAGSIKKFGWTNPLIIDSDGMILAGHGRVLAARKLGMESVPCVRVPLSGVDAKAYVLADNRLAELAGWDDALLDVELRSLVADEFDLSIIGFDGYQFDDGTSLGDELSLSRGKLNDKFMVSPFSVLNSREGWWQDRKAAWLSSGLRSVDGRGAEANKKDSGGVLMKSWSSNPEFYKQKNAVEKKLKVKLSTAEFLKNHFIVPSESALVSGTSIFDPVLTELLVRWFSPLAGVVLDPFAGGSVRGVVSARLGRKYVGQDLRPEQVDANIEQAIELCSDDDFMPMWVAGDSRQIDKTLHDVEADFILTCPPYADLEVYSDDPKDLSKLGYNEFVAAYREIIRKTCGLLKNNRFAAVVVGEVRGLAGGAYYNFVGDTVKAFMDAGLGYYNEAILVNMVGSGAMRANGQFTGSRKLVKVHQNVLVFVKGDAKLAVAALPDPMLPEVKFNDVGNGDDVSCPNCGHVWNLSGGVLMSKE